MFTALNTNSTRISIEDAIPSDSHYCPVCGNPVVVKAAHSDNIRTHFAHKRNTLCFDDWKHDMSDWHFDWQSKFPIENREIVVEKDGVFHRADVLINGTVIEFQHSPISSEEFEARNCFYKNCGYRVVWLFDATDKMKIDDCFGLVWKRKTTLFSAMSTAIDGLYIQNYLPEKGDLLCLTEIDPKIVRCHWTISPIMPDNFLEEYGVLQDDNIFSIQDIFEKTKEWIQEKNRMQRELSERQNRVAANAFFNHLIATKNKRNRRF